MTARDSMLMGLVKDLPFADYLAVDAVSSSGLKHAARSAWHYKNRIELKQTRPMLCGSLAHCAVLEPGALAQRYAVVPDNAPRRPSRMQWEAKKPSADSMEAMRWWTEFQDEVGQREIITADEFATTQAQLQAIADNPYAADILSQGYGESSVFWIDEGTGLYCKARPDWVRPMGGRKVKLADLKSTADESPSGFGRISARLRYDIQQSQYVEGFERATGLEVVEFVFIAVTSAAPVLCVPYTLTDELAEQGRDERRQLLELIAQCQRDNTWPAYGSGPQPLDFPAYAKRSTEVEVSFAD